MGPSIIVWFRELWGDVCRQALIRMIWVVMIGIPSRRAARHLLRDSHGPCSACLRRHLVFALEILHWQGGIMENISNSTTSFSQSSTTTAGPMEISTPNFSQSSVLWVTMTMKQNSMQGNELTVPWIESLIVGMFNIFYIFFVQAVFVLTSKYTTTRPTEKSAFFSTVLKWQGVNNVISVCPHPFFIVHDNDRSKHCFFATTWRRQRMRESNQFQRTMSPHLLSSPRIWNIQNGFSFSLGRNSDPESFPAE